VSFEPSDLSFEPSGPSFEPFASEYYVLHGNAYCMFAWKTSGARRRAFFAVGLEQLTNCSSPASYLPVNSVLHHAAWRDVRAAAMNPEPDPVFLQIIDVRQLVGGEPGGLICPCAEIAPQSRIFLYLGTSPIRGGASVRVRMQSERLTPRPPEKLLCSYGVAGETVRGASR